MTKQKRTHAYAKTVQGLAKFGHGVYKSAKLSYKAIKGKKSNRRKPPAYKKHSNSNYQQPKASASHGEGTSFAKLTYKPMKTAKLYKAIANLAMTEVVNTWSLTSQESAQGYIQAYIGLTGALIGSCFNNAASAINSTGSTAITNNYNQATNYSKKLLIQNELCEIRCINQMPSTAEVTIYLCLAKTSDSVTRSTSADWSTGLTNEDGSFSTTPINAFATPFASKQFNIAWKVIKKVKFALDGGAEHRHSFNFKPMRVVDMEHANDYGTIKGLTYSYLITSNGSLADTTNGITVGNIGNTPTKIIGSFRTRTNVKLVDFWPRIYKQTNSLHTGDGNLYVLNDKTLALVNTMTTTGDA